MSNNVDVEDGNRHKEKPTNRDGLMPEMNTREKMMTTAEQHLAWNLLGGITAESITRIGRADRGMARLGYEWLRYLAMKAHPFEEQAINRLYFAISIIETVQPSVALQMDGEAA